MHCYHKVGANPFYILVVSYFFTYSIHPANKKQKRETVEDTENQNNTKALIEAASAGFDDIIGHWKELLPSAVGCFSSVAGKLHFLHLW